MYFQPPSLLTKKGLGTCYALLCVSHTLQGALESGQEAGIVQVDFRAAFDWNYHQGILYSLCSVGIIGSIKVKSSMARSLPVENLLTQNVGLIIDYLQ